MKKLGAVVLALMFVLTSFTLASAAFIGVADVEIGCCAGDGGGASVESVNVTSWWCDPCAKTHSVTVGTSGIVLCPTHVKFGYMAQTFSLSCGRILAGCNGRPHGH
jgi:hypothetical protein